MPHVSGNPTWLDYPDTGTLVTAGALENLEQFVDSLLTSTTAPAVHARHQCAVSGGQNITANGAPQNIPFDVVVDAHTDVVRSGSLTSFTLKRAGVWLLSAGLRNQTTVAAGHQFMIWDGSTSTNRYVEVATGSGAATSWNVSTERRFPANQVVAAALAILTTGTNDKVATDVPGSTFFAATWLRP